MPGSSISDPGGTFLNPVYPKSFPDPFVLKHGGTYYAYSTGFAPDGTVFGIITSPDLVNWQEVGGAMPPLESAPPFYWAPEVAYDNGKFYLYYSCGNETLMHIRVAVSDRPDGGFEDAGRELTSEQFAIDAHVFVDTDGSKYMFYATDFLTHTHVGTGTVVDRMKNWFELEGDPAPVTRARFDWQVYDPDRKEKGGVRWYTVEGPSVITRKGKYFEMFSGGNWQDTSYGVSFAVSDKILSGHEWAQACDGAGVLPVLRTIPDSVVGPGHNCIVRGVNNRELYCVYHRWTAEGRVMAIDRMDFAGDRIFVIGATDTPQIAPYQPAISDLSDGRSTKSRLSTGDWKVSADGCTGSASGRCELTYDVGENFLAEFGVRSGSWNGAEPAFGFRLSGLPGEAWEFALLPATRTGSVSVLTPISPKASNPFYLPLDLLLSTSHTIRVEVSKSFAEISIEFTSFRFRSPVSFAVTAFTLFTRNTSASFAALQVTEGFEDLFENDLSNWTIKGDHSRQPRVSEGEVAFASEREASIENGSLMEHAEFAANMRMTAAGEGKIGIQLKNKDGNTVFSFGGGNGELFVDHGNGSGLVVFPVGDVDLAQYHQFRVIKLGERVIAMFDEKTIYDDEVAAGPSRLSIFCRNSSCAAEMARATAI
ncbi:MAG: glycoside hydrolase family 43 protein [Pyrinomonadaceae bacterium]